MNVTIVYFSQTGNTRKVAETMAEAFRGNGNIVSTIPMKKTTPQDVNTCNLLGIGTPCFSSQAPTPVKEFLRALPVLDGQRAFVFATSSGAPGRVLYDLTSLLEEKRAEVIGGFIARGAVSHPAPCLIGRMPNRPDKEDLASARQFVAAVAEHLSTGKSGPMVGSRPDTFKSGVGFYNMVAKLNTDGFLRMVLPEPKLDSTKCNKCNWCEGECPMDNIVMEPYPVLGKKCIRCYRCLTGCPQDAFTADWRLGNLAVWSLYNTAFERWFGDLKPGERIY